ncbi:hypothetical protein TrispH2_003550 [Trichoplax sp. H2]|nr:hypothetical protein TrispH2_003550 [Trichoplax sp. H2]|eukprot:RDD45597.1 hypothetical protein TrispH2_003550 [Trichoplax sp. H2]
MMLSHLQVLNSEEQTQEAYEQSLNKKLFEGYLWRCNGKWSQYPETDVYFYHNIIDHAIKANNHELLKSLMSDFHWMSVKLKVFQTIYKLCIDIEKYIKYLASRKEDNENYKILLSLLHQHEYYLDLESKDLVQFLLIIAFNNDSTWITNMATTLASQCSESGKYWMIAG